MDYRRYFNWSCLFPGKQFWYSLDFNKLVLKNDPKRLKCAAVFAFAARTLNYLEGGVGQGGGGGGKSV